MQNERKRTQKYETKRQFPSSSIYFIRLNSRKPGHIIAVLISSLQSCERKQWLQTGVTKGKFEIRPQLLCYHCLFALMTTVLESTPFLTPAVWFSSQACVSHCSRGWICFSFFISRIWRNNVIFAISSCAQRGLLMMMIRTQF